MDAIALVLAILALCVPFAVAQLWWWVGFWSGLAILLALVEALAFFITGRTISQQFWYWRKNEAQPWQKWCILIGMLAFWGYVLLHLFGG